MEDESIELHISGDQKSCEVGFRRYGNFFYLLFGYFKAIFSQGQVGRLAHVLFSSLQFSNLGLKVTRSLEAWPRASVGFETGFFQF